MSDAQLYAYEQFWLAVTDEEAHIETGYMRGMVEGEAKGRAEGEKNKAIETAKKMKSKGYLVDDIVEMTGLPTNTIIGL